MARPDRAASSGVSASAARSAAPSASFFDFAAKASARAPSDAADGDAERRQTLIGIVGAERQPVFGAAREHAVGLGDAAGHEIVDHHAEIAVGAADMKRASPPPATSAAFTPATSPCARGFLVAGRAVDLAGEEETRDAP